MSVRKERQNNRDMDNKGLNQHISQNCPDKRQVLQSMLGAAVMATGSGYWMEPLVKSVVLPAHAQTTTAEFVPQLEPEFDEPSLQTPQANSPANTPPLGENVVVDMQAQPGIEYSLLPHISDQESPADALSISISSLPGSGLLSLLGALRFAYEVPAGGTETSDRFEYQVVDPQGAKSPVYTVDLINFPEVPQ